MTEISTSKHKIPLILILAIVNEKQKGWHTVHNINWKWD